MPLSDSHRMTTLTGAGLAVMTLAAFYPVLSADFIHLDDTLYITENPPVQAGLTIESLRWAWTKFHAGFWAPTLWMSYMLDVELFGMNPAGFHLVNLILHIFNVLLLFTVMREATGMTWRSAALAALFAVHPMRVESVAWIAERKDTLSLFFGLLAILFYIRYTARRDTRLYLLMTVCFLLGLMAKSMLVTLPCVLLLLDLWPLGRWRRDAVWLLLREKLPLFALSAVFSILTFLAHRDFGGVQDTVNLSIAARTGHAVVAYAWYLYKTVWPTGLAVFYPYPDPSFAPVLISGAVIILAAISAVAVRRPYMLAGWLWFLGTLIPVIGLVQVGMQAWADRFLYLPVIGLLMMGVWVATDGMDRWKIKPLWRLTLMAALMATLITLTIRQSATWKNSGTVGRQALESSGKNFIAETLIGNYLEARGEIEPAIEQYRRAVQARPDYFVSHSRLGALLDRQGKTDEAIKSYVRALELNPELYGVQLMLGRALMQQGKNDVALELFQNVIVHNPGDAVAHYAAGSACEAGKDFDRALSYYSRAAQLNPVYETIRLRLIERMRQEKMKPGY